MLTIAQKPKKPAQIHNYHPTIYPHPTERTFEQVVAFLQDAWQVKVEKVLDASLLALHLTVTGTVCIVVSRGRKPRDGSESLE